MLRFAHPSLTARRAPRAATLERPAEDAGGAVLRDRLFDGAHLLALTGFALAQPLFDVLEHNVAFFAVRDTPSREIVLFALAVTFAPALALLLAESFAALVGKRARAALHLLFVGGLVALLVARAVKEELELGADATLAIVAAAALVATIAYARFAPLRSVVSAVAVAPVVFLVLFLFFSPMEKLVLPAHASYRLADVRARGPVVLVVFDEFPPVSLLDRTGRVDPIRYPSFAALARGATWYRNMSTVDTATEGAVPAILDGRYATPSRLPIFADHSQNVFTLLGRRYRLNVWESVTHLCPPRLCRPVLPTSGFTTRMGSLFSDVGVLYLHMLLPKEYEVRLPSIATSWGEFGAATGAGNAGSVGPARPAFFRRFVRSVRASRWPALNVVHVLLPHGHWIFLPSCRRYAVTTSVSPGLGVDARWTRDAWPVTQAYQRHLLQVECTDRLLGSLLGRLRATGLYDRSLLIVTADHGVSIRPGELRRRVDPDHPTNLADIAFAPLFVKLPGQRRGRVVDRHVQTVDIVPTIADVLGIRIPWHVDGRSLLERGHPSSLHLLTRSGKVITAPSAALDDDRAELLRRQLSLFGSRRRGLYRIGPHPELLGRRLDELTVRAATATASLDSYTATRLRSLERRPRVVPTPVAGTLSGPGADPGADMAVAVNGRIVAVTRSIAGHGSTEFQALVPQSSYRPGRNTIQVFWIDEGAAGVTLERLRVT